MGYIQKKEPVFLLNLSLFSSSSFSLLVGLFYICVLHCLPLSNFWIITNATAWRIILSGGLGILLKNQSSSEFWTNYFLQNGKTRQEAFAQWKALYNFVLSMTGVRLLYSFSRSWFFFSIIFVIFRFKLYIDHSLNIYCFILHINYSLINILCIVP